MQVESSGKVSYNKNILLSVINLAAKEISGVAGLCRNFGGSWLGKKMSGNYCEGVRVSQSTNGLVIDIYLNIYSNYKVAEVAARVQENVKSGITTMMDVDVNAINIRVMGIEFLQTAQDEAKK
ncbi:MAG: Asp23/Gls24 family envelope stress response protein [Firmicutes bacterium]|nr:Asp23/Gls24 family envelope stress response protein [Bacillota bacterium]